MACSRFTPPADGSMHSPCDICGNSLMEHIPSSVMLEFMSTRAGSTCTSIINVETIPSGLPDFRASSNRSDRSRNRIGKCCSNPQRRQCACRRHGFRFSARREKGGYRWHAIWQGFVQARWIQAAATRLFASSVTHLIGTPPEETQAECFRPCEIW